MIRLRTLTLPVLLALTFCPVAVATEGSDEPTERENSQFTFDIGNRKAPTATQRHVIAKSFLDAMRRHGSVTTDQLRNKYFAPSYLKKHGLTEKNVPVRMAPVRTIYNIQVADDDRTLVSFVKTEQAREVILFQTVVEEGNLYLLPLTDPDSESGEITPWILRMIVETPGRPE